MQSTKRLSFKDVNMLSGKILPEMIKFAIPIIFAGVLQQLYNAADIIVVGNFGGKEALAAIGATTSIISLLVNVFINIFIGTNILVARSVGAGDDAALRKVVSTTYVMSLVLGVGIMIAGELLAVPLLEMTGCPANVIGGAAKYMKIYFLGIPASMFMNFASSVIRTSGDSRSPFVYMSLSGIANVVCNIAFVLIFGDPVAGVAIATVVAMYLSAAMFFVHMIRLNGPTKLNPFSFRFNYGMFAKTIRYGIPSVISGATFSITNIIIQPAVNAYGDIGISGSAASSSIEAFIFAITSSFMAATVAFVGQNIGAGNRERVLKIIKVIYLFAISVMLVFSAVMLSLGDVLLSLYIPGEAEAIAFAKTRYTMIMGAAVLSAMMNVNAGILQAYGYTIMQMMSNLVGVCVFRLAWMAFVYPIDMTPFNLWVCYPISWLLTAVTVFVIVLVLTKKYKAGKEFRI